MKDIAKTITADYSESNALIKNYHVYVEFVQQR